MNWFLAGWVLVLQTAFWGVGLTLLILPRRWRLFWPAFCAPVGLALQSAVVWAGAHTRVPGTDAYAYAALALPAGLLAVAWWRLGTRPVVQLLGGVRRWWVLALVMSVSLDLLIAPFTKPPARFTVMSLGSCDAADYAAGARVLKEFSSADRSGFIGQTEVVRVLSVDNFYDFWLRLNHFTPSALIALDASLLRREPYEITSLLGIVLLLVNLPVVFWLARSVFRFGPWGAATVALIYGCSPVLFYAVYQVALGQLIAAPAVGLIFWTCLQADRAARQGLPRRLWAWSGLLLAGNWLLLGGYNFFLLFAYVPLVAFVGGRLLLRWRRREEWRAMGRLAGFIVVNLLACTLLFPERVISLGERFLLFDKTPFGWRIPAFRPDGWYGTFGTALLDPAPLAFLALGIACLLALGAMLWHLARRGHRRIVGLAAACTLPIFCGYGILTWEELAHVRLNASYDAYKLFTVFYPLLLASLCLWMGLRRSAPPWAWCGAAVLAAGVIFVNVQGARRYNLVLRRAAYVVDRNLIELSALERTPNVDAVNVHLQTYWDRLWANQFLLHRKQYFAEATYEGRRATGLHARWDLRERFINVEPPEGDAILAGDSDFTLLDREGPKYLDLELGTGWYDPERDRTDHWSWSRGAEATVTISNAHPEAVDATLRVRARSLTDRHVRLYAGTVLLWEGQTGFVTQQVAEVAVHLPPGETRLRFVTDEPPVSPPGDSRTLTFALCGLRIRPNR